MNRIHIEYIANGFLVSLIGSEGSTIRIYHAADADAVAERVRLLLTAPEFTRLGDDDAAD